MNPRPPLRLTLGGNATVWLESAGFQAVTDPWLSERIGPWKRLRPAGIASASLSAAQVVLISHAHPDHLDLATLEGVARDTPILSPHGAPQRKLERAGFRRVIGLADWEEWEGEDGRVVATPCVHTRWSLGFVLYLAGGTVYFAGDAAPRTPFREIRERCGPLDVALMPVGGSVLAPAPLQRHLTPELAARATAELGPKVVVPMHWGHVPCVPSFIDGFRGTAAGFAAALRELAPNVRMLMPGDGAVTILDFSEPQGSRPGG